jgi:hypothetical protein
MTYSYVHSLSVVRSKKKNMRKMEKKKKTNNGPNPLTCESHILTSWSLKLDPMVLILSFVALKK